MVVCREGARRGLAGRLLAGRRGAARGGTGPLVVEDSVCVCVGFGKHVGEVRVGVGVEVGDLGGR